MSYSSVLAQSQRFFFASKPTRLSLIFNSEFPTDVLKKIWTIHRWYVRSTILPLESPWSSQLHQ